MFADRIFAIVDDALAAIAGVSAELYHRRGVPVVLPHYFRLLFCLQRATPGLVRLALDRLSAFDRSDFHIRLAHHFEHVINEESGHDEIMVRDLVRLGFSANSVRNDLPSAAITSLIGSQYYLVSHHHPALLLGYASILEAYTPSESEVDQFVADSGAPVEAFTNFRLHVELDTDHRAETKVILDAVPEDAGLRRAITTNALRTADFFCQALEDIFEQTADASEPQPRAATPIGSIR